MRSIEVGATLAAPPERVWDLLVDVEDWPRWSVFDEVHVESGSGVGRVQRLRNGRVTGRERVTALEPPRRMAYELLGGLPVRDYRGEVVLAPAGGGSAITWRSTFRGAFPLVGAVLARGLTKMLDEHVSALAREAERS